MPVPAPGLPEVLDYLNSAGLPTSNEGAILTALDAETAAQLKAVKVPEDGYTADLVEALCRRVAHTLTIRPLALGLQVELSDTTGISTRVGGLDAEVRRLEAPYRRRPVA
ncbi:hypothetical protein EUA93_18890 [Nocardioides oleivorans]|uniref:Uncharacterized protein n=1 Tax=Nocardioides oleivorans TaxID=273676 RepID=A0A4Q2RU97_9ACTN|nr:hypothetical protein [Nocardioides oleivorans]RYB91003.1 hypothetical protein EUA93_18890 [Nocardioides oleivorans]